MKPIIIAIAGGSASGKSSVVNEIVSNLKSIDITVICHDDYYKDQTHLSMEQRVLTNYDHPNSLDNDFILYTFIPKMYPFITNIKADYLIASHVVNNSYVFIIVVTICII